MAWYPRKGADEPAPEPQPEVILDTNDSVTIDYSESRPEPDEEPAPKELMTDV